MAKETLELETASCHMKFLVFRSAATRWAARVERVLKYDTTWPAVVTGARGRFSSAETLPVVEL